MKKLNMESAVKRYNKLMEDLSLEYHTIGTKFSEGTEGWNIRDMVSEAQYQLNLYYTEGTSPNEMRYFEDEDVRKEWRSNVGKLERFVNAYKPFIENVVCKERHSSEYDN